MALILEAIAYDTNILAYIQGVEVHKDDAAKIDAARLLHTKLSGRCRCVAPQQALGEFYTLLVRLLENRHFARRKTRDFSEEFEAFTPTAATYAAALDLATDHKLQFWDSLILATAADAGCGLLLSEDMQDGFEWHGVTVADPFAAKLHRKLARVLAG